MTELERYLVEALKRFEKEQKERNEQLSKQLNVLQEQYSEALSYCRVLETRYDELNSSISKLLKS